MQFKSLLAFFAMTMAVVAAPTYDDHKSHDFHKIDKFDHDKFDDDKFDHDKFDHDKFDHDKSDHDKFDDDKFDHDKFDDDKFDHDKFDDDKFDHDKGKFGDDHSFKNDMDFKSEHHSSKDDHSDKCAGDQKAMCCDSFNKKALNGLNLLLGQGCIANGVYMSILLFPNALGPIFTCLTK
ncbi:hypothetical protein FQN54_001891 [Arachnomyces sp. PD_36]|nr:hypothetical protein FQN54_001891 [Arachnomyces sp. PD_36]